MYKSGVCSVDPGAMPPPVKTIPCTRTWWAPAARHVGCQSCACGSPTPSTNVCPSTPEKSAFDGRDSEHSGLGHGAGEIT